MVNNCIFFLAIYDDEYYLQIIMKLNSHLHTDHTKNRFWNSNISVRCFSHIGHSVLLLLCIETSISLKRKKEKRKKKKKKRKEKEKEKNWFFSFSPFLEAFPWETDQSNARLFYGKNAKFEKGICILIENWLCRHEMQCAVVNTNIYMCHIHTKEFLDLNFD